MSRVVGIAGAPAAAVCGGLADLFAGVGSEPDRQVALASEGAALGWSGRRETPPIARIGPITVVLDGWFYNRGELPHGASDAETFAQLYAKHGAEESLRRVNGDFALALFDETAGALFVARDRFGTRPLYFARTPELVAFASRPRPLLRLSGVSNVPDRRFVALFAASHYRVFDNDPWSSPYRDIGQVPAAHVLTFRSGAMTASRYWTLAGAPELEESEAALAERYRELLLDAVAIRLAVARRPAFTLSGGMDSSSVLGSAVLLSGERQTAFSTVYPDPTFDERHDIEPMIEAAVDTWQTVEVTEPDVFALVRRMIDAHDEPVATATWLSHFLLCERASELGFGSLLGGLGGDELNAGEYEYFPFHFADLRVRGREDELAHEVELWAANHDHPVFRKGPAVAEELLARLVALDRPGVCLPDRPRLLRYAAALDPGFYDLEHFEPVMEHPFPSYLKNRTYQDLTRETLPCCLRAEDRQTLAFGLDHFLPFLDHRLVEFMFRVPGHLKIRDGVTKRLLRTATVGILPDETRLRVKKTGWNAPAHRWFTGDAREQLLDLVSSQSFGARGIYNVREVERLIADHERIVTAGIPAENHMMFLWQLVNLELWLSEVDADRRATPDREEVQAR